nr:hypothetical protein CFP56_36543 [Quercus suber]
MPPLRRTKRSNLTEVSAYSYRPPSSSSSKSNCPRGYDDKVPGVHSGLWGRKEEKPMEESRKSSLMEMMVILVHSYKGTKWK